MTASRLGTVPEPQAAGEPNADESALLREFDCDACGESFAGRPGGAGLFVWTRGEEVRYEEPPLCDDCAERIALGAVLKWSEEDDGG